MSVDRDAGGCRSGTGMAGCIGIDRGQIVRAVAQGRRGKGPSSVAVRVSCADMGGAVEYVHGTVCYGSPRQGRRVVISDAVVWDTAAGEGDYLGNSDWCRCIPDDGVKSHRESTDVSGNIRGLGRK